VYAATSIVMLIGKILLYSILHKHIDSGVLWHLWLCLLYNEGHPNYCSHPHTVIHCVAPLLYMHEQCAMLIVKPQWGKKRIMYEKLPLNCSYPS